MANIQEVADQINAKLDGILANTSQSVTLANQTNNELANLSNKVSVLDVHLQSGVANLAGGLNAIWELGKAQLVQLEHHSRQNDTVICLLENADELLCGITRKLTSQLELSSRIARSLLRVERITERVEPAAAADVDRLADISDRIAHCCPPPKPEPEPCPQPCPSQPLRPHKPKGQDWKPQQPPKSDQPRVNG